VSGTRWTRLAVGFVVAAVLAAGQLIESVQAYSGSAAASYADANWKECWDPPYSGSPPSPYECFANDCANYVSQAMHAGGYPFHYGFVPPWYYFDFGTTVAWYQAGQLYYFLVYGEPQNGFPGGYVAAVKKGASSTQNYNVLGKGDLIFFDWEDNSSIDHVRMEVGWGTPPSTGYKSTYNAWWYTGDWADQHTPPRYHDFWNGYYAMDATTRSTVRISEVRIYSSN
jgi:hypothetical protein